MPYLKPESSLDTFDGPARCVMAVTRMSSVSARAFAASPCG